SVALLDAGGQPILKDGRPLEATTDAEGAYAFTVDFQPRNWQVRVELPHGRGQLAAIVPKTGDERLVDVDLVSSLTTTYILEAYVKSQPDAQETLDKLPPAIEAETRQKAQAALESGQTPLPDSLETAALMATVEALRRQDAGFDAQMETVKALLIAAGLSDLGSGQAATDVFMARMFEVEGAADGTIYMFCSDDRRIWRVTPAGRLETAVGSGHAPDKAARTGKRGREVAIDHVFDMKIDAQGRLCFAELDRGIWRLEPDGSLTELVSSAALTAALGSGGALRAFALRPDGQVLVCANEALWGFGPGGAERIAATPGLQNAFDIGLDAQGRLFLTRFDALYRFDPADQQLTLLKADGAPEVQGSVFGAINTVSLDAHGNYFYVAAADQMIHILRPDGTDTALVPRSQLKNGLMNARAGRDGTLYLVDCDPGITTNPARLLKVENGALTLLAGRDTYPTGFSASGAFSLQSPFGLDVLPDGTLLIADNGALLQVSPGGGVEVLHASGTIVNGVAVQFTGVKRLESGVMILRAASSAMEYMIRRDPAGTLTVRHAERKTFANLHHSTIFAFEAAEDETIYMSRILYDRDSGDQRASVIARGPQDLLPRTLLPESEGVADVLKLKLEGEHLRLLGTKPFPGGAVQYRIRPDGAIEALDADAFFPDAVDAAGRAYEGDAVTMTGGQLTQRRIRRLADGAVTVVAGQGGPIFDGSGLDDSILAALDLAFDRAGNLYFRDQQRRQVRRVPKERL
ncbi:MAG: hypothetical protein ACLGIN_00390, partial [Candidatus Sericytochromatia bacterium]